MAIKRIMGTETEYGILGASAEKVINNYRGESKSHKNKSATNESVIEGLKDKGHFGGDYEGQETDETIANSIGLTKQKENYSHYFGKDEMLANGARFYIDLGHPEYSTPECSNPISAVIADKAGERILEIASEYGKIARIFKNNTDGINSYGAHENYFVDRTKMKNFMDLADFMTPFFVSRIIFTGSGKIGFMNEKCKKLEKTRQRILSDFYSLEPRAIGKMANLYQKVMGDLEKVMNSMKEEELMFHISQRADFFTKLVALQTTYDRPIINTRDEPLADKEKYFRFHVINGDANMSEIATYLKLGTTSIVLDLFEDEKIKPFQLEDAVDSFHLISKDLSFKARVNVNELGDMTAIEIQRFYQEAAEKAYRGRDDITDDILDRWKFVLDALKTDKSKLNRQIDWIIKKNLIDSYRQSTGKRISDISIRNIDLQYHEINREKGLFYMLQSRGMVDRLISDEQIEYAVNNPPVDTRAYLRGNLIKRNLVFNSDWDKISLSDNNEILLSNPLNGTKKDLGELFEEEKLNNNQLLLKLNAKGYIKNCTNFELNSSEEK